VTFTLSRWASTLGHLGNGAKGDGNGMLAKFDAAQIRGCSFAIQLRTGSIYPTMFHGFGVTMGFRD